MSFDASLRAALAPPLAVVEARPASRFVARPGEVIVGDLTGAAENVEWDDARQAALAAGVIRGAPGVVSFRAGRDV